MIIRRIRYTKPTIEISIISGVIGVAVNAFNIFREFTSSGANVITIAGLVLAVLGISLTHKRMKSAAFCFVGASLLSLPVKISGADFWLPCVWGICYAVSSMNDFQLINLEAPLPESSDDVIDDMLSGKMMADAAGKQDEWLKRVNDFISRYTVFAYYGYMFAVMACLFLNGARLFAPEMWEGYSRDFWALLAAGGLAAVAGVYTESARRKF